MVSNINNMTFSLEMKLIFAKCVNSKNYCIIDKLTHSVTRNQNLRQAQVRLMGDRDLSQVVIRNVNIIISSCLKGLV